MRSSQQARFSIRTVINVIPPVSRFTSALALATAVVERLQYIRHYELIFNKDLVFKKYQFWRLYTSFFSGYASRFNLLYELLIFYPAMRDLEVLAYSRSPADFVWQLFWACCTILVVTWPLNLSEFSHPLLICIVYLQTCLAKPGTTIMFPFFLEVFTIPTIYYPIILIGLNPSLGSLAGAAVGHLWWWIAWRGHGVLQNYLSKAPQWLCRLMGQSRLVGRPLGRE